MGEISLTKQQMAMASKKIRKHYALIRVVTDKEVMDEVANLKRKNEKGNLDDRQLYLLSTLCIGKDAIII
jgi:hypothetical protein